MSGWYELDAEVALAKARLAEQRGPCPNCGAPADVEAISVRASATEPYAFIAGIAKCSARCDLVTPDAYLVAVRAS